MAKKQAAAVAAEEMNEMPEPTPVAPPPAKRKGTRQWEVLVPCYEAWGPKGTSNRKYFRRGTRFTAPAWWEPTPGEGGVVRHMRELTPEVLAQEEAARIEDEQEAAMNMDGGMNWPQYHRRGVVKADGEVITSGGIR